MQTFVPYPDDTTTALCLDDKRLLKQIVECAQILKALGDPTYGWQNHPAVRMWRGFVPRLVNYTWTLQDEYAARRGRTVRVDLPLRYRFTRPENPGWWGGPIHATHRARLLRKAPGHYRVFGWQDDPSTPYHWPVS